MKNPKRQMFSRTCLTCWENVKRAARHVSRVTVCQRMCALGWCSAGFLSVQYTQIQTEDRDCLSHQECLRSVNISLLFCSSLSHPLFFVSGASPWGSWVLVILICFVFGSECHLKLFVSLLSLFSPSIGLVSSFVSLSYMDFHALIFALLL